MGTSRLSKPIMTDPELLILLGKAKEKYEAMTDAEKEAMMAEQRRSWFIGELMLAHPELTREEANERFEQANKLYLGSKTATIDPNKE